MPEIRNPNQGGSQDNRSFLVMMIVMLGVIFGLQYWRAQRNPKLESPDHPAAVSTPATTTSSTPAAPTAAPGSHPSSDTTCATPAVVAAAQTSTVVENELYRITFSNRGGEVTSWILKKLQGQQLDTPSTWSMMAPPNSSATRCRSTPTTRG